MLPRFLRFPALTLALAAATAAGHGTTAAAATVIADGSGHMTAGDCTFACVLRYQQVYTSDIFSGPVTIDSIDFLSSSAGYWGREAQYEARFSVVSNGVNALSAQLDENVGAQEARFELRGFTGSVLADSYFGFSGSYVYDPSQGDLLVDIVRVRGMPGGPDVYYNIAGDTGQEYSRAYSISSLTDGYAGPLYGNVTRFMVTPLPVDPVPNVPLPASLPLLALGLGSMCVLRRRQRR